MKSLYKVILTLNYRKFKKKFHSFIKCIKDMWRFGQVYFFIQKVVTTDINYLIKKINLSATGKHIFTALDSYFSNRPKHKNHR